VSVETFSLPGDARPIELEKSGITLVAPGLIGAGTGATADPQTNLRSLTRDATEADRALAEAGLEERHTIVIEAPTPPAAAAGRSFGAVADDELAVQVPLAEKEVAFLIYTDEAGRASFHYRRKVAEVLPTRATTAARQDQFLVPLRRGASQAGGEGRGLFGKVLAKVIRVIVVNLLADQVGGYAARRVQAWEAKHRAHQGFHGGSAEDLLAAQPRPCALGKLRGQKALLFIHGTTSTTAGAFGRLRGTDLLPRLYRHYEDRVIGFNHHTMGASVEQNVADFFKALEPFPGDYLFDVVCHSRGGLVARALAAKAGGAGSVRLHIDRLVFVATPNSGTDLAIPDRIPAFVDRLANYVNMLPDSVATIATGALLSIAGSIAEVALPRLPGLADQAPGSPLLEALAAAPRAAQHFAFQSDYTASGDLVEVIKDRVADRIFGETKNDVVVPTEGVSRGMQVAPQHLVAFGRDDKVHHTNFFGHPKIARLADFLEAQR
jgi:pimeloyl-ACP methyl ester carboxylesterase